MHCMYWEMLTPRITQIINIICWISNVEFFAYCYMHLCFSVLLTHVKSSCYNLILFRVSLNCCLNIILKQVVILWKVNWLSFCAFMGPERWPNVHNLWIWVSNDRVCTAEHLPKVQFHTGINTSASSWQTLLRNINICDLCICNVSFPFHSFFSQPLLNKA